MSIRLVTELLPKFLALAARISCSGGATDGHNDYDATSLPPPDSVAPIDQHVKDVGTDGQIEPPDTKSQDDDVCCADTFPDTFDTEFTPDTFDANDTPLDTFQDTLDGMCKISETCAPLDSYEDTNPDTDTEVDAEADDGIVVIPELPIPFDTPVPPDITPPPQDTTQPPPPDVIQPSPDIEQPDIEQPSPDTVQPPPPDVDEPPPDVDQPDTIQPPPEDVVDTSPDPTDAAGDDGAVQCAPISLDDPTCNGIDDDCDGVIDDDYLPKSVSCGVGECFNTNLSSCTNGVEDKSCAPKEGFADDPTCDNLDDDCDGITDDDYIEEATTCGDGACFAKGAWVCIAGILDDTCVQGTPTPETCDEIDNDCDKETDEGCECVPATYKPITTTCGKGECASTGETSCKDDHVEDSCKEKAPPMSDDSLCDNKDNDCDGSTDEDYLPETVTCGLGVCLNIDFTSCADGIVDASCTPKDGSAGDPTCNGLDDDCDGVADDDYAPYQITCGVGECKNTVTSSCDDGVENNQCAPGTPTDEICDGKDNNCNGLLTDEGLVTDLTLAINCYSDPSKSSKLSPAECMNSLTTPGTVAGAKAYISVDKAESGGIKTCYDKNWTGMPGDPACPAGTPLPIGCASEIEFEISFFGTQYIWQMFNEATVLASLHFDKTKEPDVASIQVFLNDPKCNVLYNAFSCPK